MKRRELLRGLGTGIVTEPLFSRRANTQTDGREEWTFETKGEVNSSLTVVDGTVYIGSDDTLYAVDAASGREEWTFETKGEVNSSPTVVDGTVYIGNDGTLYDSILYAVDAASGREEWTSETKGEANSSPTVVDGTVYIGNYDTLYAVDAASGREEWTFDFESKILATPQTVVDGTVYVGSDGTLYAVDAASGREEWTFKTTGEYFFFSPTVADGTVYVGGGDYGAGDDTLYAVDAASGREEWTFEKRDVNASPTVADGTVYVGGGYSILYAVDAASGREEWTFETKGEVDTSPTVADGTVYVGTDDTLYDSILYAVDAASGREEWTFETKGEVNTSPTVADGTVYVGSYDTLYAVAAGPMQTPTLTPALGTTTGNRGALFPSVTVPSGVAAGGGLLAVLCVLTYAVFRSSDGFTTDVSPRGLPRAGQDPASERAEAPESVGHQGELEADRAAQSHPVNSGGIPDGETESQASSDDPHEAKEVLSTETHLNWGSLTKDQIDRVEEIGGMHSGVVYEATAQFDETSKTERFAFKEPHVRHIDDALARFRQEAAKWETLTDHPYIVEVYAVNRDPPWIAMEFMNKYDLGSYRSRFRLENDEVLWFGECLADALGYAHKNNIVHTDIKPGNILLTSETDAPWNTPKIADWGLARFLSEHKGSQKEFTYQYGAPEQFHSDQFGDVGTYTDQYQLGMVLYQLLANNHPFPRRSENTDVRSLREQPPRDLRKDSDIPDSVVQVIEKMLEPYHEDRYDDIGMVQEKLSELRRQSSIEQTISVAELASVYADLLRQSRHSYDQVKLMISRVRRFVSQNEIDNQAYEETLNHIERLENEWLPANEPSDPEQEIDKDSRREIFNRIEQVSNAIEDIYVS